MKNLLYFNDFLNENYHNIKIPKMSINGIFYHGTTTNDDGVFTELTSNNSDWEAIWFTSDESIAEEYAEDKKYSEESEINTIYKTKVKSNKIANINYELSQQIVSEYELFDFRDCIEILQTKGFEGWKVPGSIGRRLYDDYAIFNADLIEILSVKFLIDNKWTEYMSLEDANIFINNHLSLSS